MWVYQPAGMNGSQKLHVTMAFEAQIYSATRLLLGQSPITPNLIHVPLAIGHRWTRHCQRALHRGAEPNGYGRINPILWR